MLTSLLIVLTMFTALIISSLKLTFSNNMMTCLISIEVMMASSMILMMSMNFLWDQCYFLLTLVCFTVCEGTIGLSILSSLNKFSGNFYLYSLK